MSGRHEVHSCRSDKKRLVDRRAPFPPVKEHVDANEVQDGVGTWTIAISTGTRPEVE